MNLFRIIVNEIWSDKRQQFIRCGIILFAEKEITVNREHNTKETEGHQQTDLPMNKKRKIDCQELWFGDVNR
jgi:hypothetical protein